MKAPIKILTALALIAIPACSGGGGGGGGGGPVVPPPSSPPPSPPPPPPPPSPGAAFFENNEYDRDYSKALIRASSAYAAGGTGVGVTIAVIDTGIDLQHAEFLGGKLSAASIDIYSGAYSSPFTAFTPGVAGLGPIRDRLDDEQGHGTGTASAAAGAKLPEDDPLIVAGGLAGMHGVAFDATVLAIRADDSDPACAPDCDFDTRGIAAAIDYAVANGAKVINLSLGGDATPSAAMNAAMTRAAAAGVIVVAASGNDGNAQPDSPANFAGSVGADGHVIAVGSVNSASEISSFSNRAGALANFYVVAPGQGLVVATPVDLANPASCPHTGNTCYNIQSAGTSYASPQVAGAIALLLDAFPSLSPEAVVTRLLTTATDLGVAGPDSTYGRGLINLQAAFAPVGTSSITFGGAVVPLDLALAPPSGATGDWLTASGLLDGAILRDSQSVAFEMAPEAGPVGSSVLGSFEAAALGQRIDARRVTTRLRDGSIAYAAFRGPDDVYIAHPNLMTDELLTPELSLTLRQGPLSFAMGRGFAAPAALGGSGIATLTPAATSGALAALTATGDWASVGYDLGAWSLGVRSAGDDTRSFSATTLTRRFGAQQAGVEIGAAHEDETALGGAAGSRFGGEDSADSSFAALSWRGPVASRWTGAARIEAAHARLDMPSAVRVVEDPVASAWTISLERPLARGVDLGLTLAQPLRAETGRVALIVPVGVTAVNASIYEERFAGLQPSGREIDLETALRLDLGPSAEGRLALRLADDVGHVASSDLEGAVWLGLRWTR